MPSISSKAHEMPESPIRKLVPYAENAVREGKEVLYLNIGQPDIKTPEVVLERLRNIDRTVIEYSHSAGYESYRKGLAKYYKGAGIDIDHTHVMVTTGGSEALLFGFMTCFNAGDEIIIPEPFYANYNGFSTASNLVIKPVTADIDNGFALPPIAEFEKMITDKTRGILICNPGNPTGYLYTQDELNSLRDLVIKYDLFLFADEVYREFCYDGHTHHSVMNLEGIEQNVVMVDSVSKRYSMCGARIGALISRNKEIMNAALKFGQARLSPPTLGQIASEAALDTPAEYFTEVIGEYVQRRNLLVEGLNKIPGVKCPKPKGAFYAIAELPVEDAEAFCTWLLQSFDFNGQTIMMAPANGFYSDPNKGKKEVRLAYVLEQSKLQDALDILHAALETYNVLTVVS